MLKPKDIAAKQGWSLYRTLRLINQGKIPAVNTGTASVPRWEVRPEDLEAFLTPVKKEQPEPVRRRRRIDDDVEKYDWSR